MRTHDDDDDDDDVVAQHGGHTPRIRLTETYSLGLPCTSLLDIPAMIKCRFSDWIAGLCQVNLLKTGQDCSGPD